ncbi:MAG: hypothetical protein M5U28_19465 [Sandaracinaceae bacterium]|nr:hypothetical protein [Sandaracinaceae bacterium]
MVFLGALAAAGFAYLEAGGMHGWNSFRVGNLFSSNDAPFASSMAIGLFLVSLMLMAIGGGKKKDEKK